MLPEAVCNRIHTNHADAVETLSRLIDSPAVAAPQPQDGYPYGSLPQMPWTLCCTTWKNWA